jgi:hypothetical protein
MFILDLLNSYFPAYPVVFGKELFIPPEDPPSDDDTETELEDWPSIPICESHKKV